MACDTRASDKGPAVAVSVWGEQYTMGVHEVSQLSLREFSTLWTDYVRKLAKYLVQVILGLLLTLSCMWAYPLDAATPLLKSLTPDTPAKTCNMCDAAF